MKTNSKAKFVNLVAVSADEVSSDAAKASEYLSELGIDVDLFVKNGLEKIKKAKMKAKLANKLHQIDSQDEDEVE